MNKSIIGYTKIDKKGLLKQTSLEVDDKRDTDLRTVKVLYSFILGLYKEGFRRMTSP